MWSSLDESIGPAHRLERQNRAKTPKWSENYQFRQFNYLNKRIYGSNYTPFDAELQKGFFEITSRSVGCFVLELWRINVSKNQSTKFCPPDGHGCWKVHFRWRLGIRSNLVEMLSTLSWVSGPSFISIRAILFKKSNIEK